MSGQVIDPHKSQKGKYFTATNWALPYLSAHTSENDLESNNNLGHVNCGYLSTPGFPPTLAALKKHAQALTILISQLAPSRKGGEIDNANIKMPKAMETAGWTPEVFQELEAFDWLNDLSKPYETEDPDHHRPLNSLVNAVRANSDTKGVEFHCPLTEHPLPPQFVDGIRVGQNPSQEEIYYSQRALRPHARHMSLLQHANECLEMLDHEFSATGGLLSILPTERGGEWPQFEAARDTLIGQWLLFTQQLVSRQHDLEIDFANARDALGGELVVPPQHLSTHGPDGRSGREMVWPQDRFVLANAGDDVCEFLHQSLDRKLFQKIEKVERQDAQGVTSEKLKGPDDQERGIISIDLTTRYYRLTGDNDRSPIIILPAYADRPGTKFTRDLERRPTVVTVPEPKFPARFTEMEKGIDAMKKENISLKLKDLTATAEVQKTVQENQILQQEVAQLRAQLDAYRQGLQQDGQMNASKLSEYATQLDQTQKAYVAEKNRADKLEKDNFSLAPNALSYNKLGALPRDTEGNVTNEAMLAMLDMMKRITASNTAMAEELAELRAQPAEPETNGQTSKTSQKV